MDYDKVCPDCGLMLDYVFDFTTNTIGYWCHLCGWKREYVLKVQDSHPDSDLTDKQKCDIIYISNQVKEDKSE